MPGESRPAVKTEPPAIVADAPPLARNPKPIVAAGVLARIVVSVRSIEEPASCTTTALKPVDVSVLLVTVAWPPLKMKAAFARLPAAETVESETVACEPASCTENPVPRCPVPVSVLPLIWSTPPDIARAAEVGSVSAADVPLVVRLLFVSDMVPPSARAALANVPEIFAVTLLPVIWLPAPSAYKP